MEIVEVTVKCTCGVYHTFKAGDRSVTYCNSCGRDIRFRFREDEDTIAFFATRVKKWSRRRW